MFLFNSDCYIIDYTYPGVGSPYTYAEMCKLVLFDCRNTTGSASKSRQPGSHPERNTSPTEETPGSSKRKTSSSSI